MRLSGGKMGKLFQGNRKFVFVIVLMCITMLCIVLLKLELSDVIKKDAALVLRVPEKYSTLMSSAPGLVIQVDNAGKADEIRYTTDYGSFLTWKGRVTTYGKSVTQPIDELVYWSPLEEEKAEMPEQDTYFVKVEALKEGKKLKEQSVQIKRDKTTLMYYPVEDLPNVIILD